MRRWVPRQPDRARTDDGNRNTGLDPRHLIDGVHGTGERLCKRSRTIFDSIRHRSEAALGHDALRCEDPVMPVAHRFPRGTQVDCALAAVVAPTTDTHAGQGGHAPSDPRRVNPVANLTDTLFATHTMVRAAIRFFGLASFGLVVLVFLLSFRLREREMLTYAKIGASYLTIVVLKSAEVAIVLFAGIVIALGSLLATKALAAELLPILLH